MEDAQAFDIAVRAARTGGQVALARLGKSDYMRWKGHRDIVSGASIEVQDAILDVLRRETPDFGILAEEGPEDEPLPLDAEHLWIVDPICGRPNYSRASPTSASRSRCEPPAQSASEPCTTRVATRCSPQH